MKYIVFFVLILFVVNAIVTAEDSRGVSIGVHVLGGGRYDNVRMCVGSPSGVPGGPIGEVYIDIRVPAGERGTVVFNIPLFRPIVFATAFRMMQVEPVVMYEHTLGDGTGSTPIVGGGLGIVLHYGPDYHSSKDNRGESFFSIGPLLNGFAGLQFEGSNFTAGVKGFLSPLFTPGRPVGIVAGGGVEIHYVFSRS